MSRQTEMLLAPTLDEVKAQALKIGLPAMEGEKFFYYYESNGWRVGKVKMRSWTSALSGWKLRWQERRGSPPPNNRERPAPVSGVPRDFNAKLESTVNQLKNRR